MWESGRLECLRKLLRWSSLRENTLVEITEEPGKEPPEDQLHRLFSEQYQVNTVLLKLLIAKSKWAILCTSFKAH